MKRILIAVAAVAMAACQPMPTDGGGPTEFADLADQGVVTTTRVPDCEARGGKMLPQGRMQTMMCVVNYADAGQRCTDGDQCQGDCRIEDVADAPSAGAPAVGRCQVSSSAFGCYTTVEDGKAEATLCVD
ncbi:MAG: hypothetical protein Q8O54_12340 [Brevundimonas sp.]|nr:hypothetical protein [Brevundimonas sp.]